MENRSAAKGIEISSAVQRGLPSYDCFLSFSTLQIVSVDSLCHVSNNVNL